MSLSEAEAKGKRCCGPEGCGTTLAAAGTSVAHWRFCVASACMAWRKTGQIGIGPNGEKRSTDLDGRTRWTDVGRCGLAGPRDLTG